ncbi:DUF4189 domain-containing protein [Inquilinus sp. Marseille-Q2685]|uniref:DUF4189 domain-containing protein n=1 Tax=Inquilinus sp. Marseille-Q2685 TaxID=2866581 RepID=UPI001CE3FAFA|nr:DUF4189 domain-containing protein [Inquilinus sp. Marseille-Q2685]
MGRGILKGLAVVAALLGVALAHGEAQAEDGCPEGSMPVPEQYTDPANGTLQLRINCLPGSRYPDPVHQGPSQSAPPPDGYGAFATDPGHRQLFWSTFYGSEQEAEQAAIENCGRATGQRCKSLGWFGNQCGAVAVTQTGQTITGYGTSWRGAAKDALDACEKAGAGAYTICRLWVPPVCSGASFTAEDNEPARTATVDEIEEMSAEIVDREYWGAVASDGHDIRGGYGLPDRRSAERVALSKCTGCKIVQVFESSCAGIAWPTDGRPVYEVVVNTDPAVAKARAKAQCTGEYGACEAGVRCSGRRYPASNPDAAAAPAGGG